MRKPLGVLAGVGAVLAIAAFTPARDVMREAFAGQGPPINLAARQETYRGNALVVVSFSDTNSQTVVRTDIRRRSTGTDTVWVIRGFTTGKGDSVPGLRARMTFRDEAVSFDKTYRYQARDSISGAALTTWSDSVSITVANFVRSQ
jgi:hypothetical protein